LSHVQPDDVYKLVRLGRACDEERFLAAFTRACHGGADGDCCGAETTTGERHHQRPQSILTRVNISRYPDSTCWLKSLYTSAHSALAITRFDSFYHDARHE
jgi:hypothetical protein